MNVTKAQFWSRCLNSACFLFSVAPILLYFLLPILVNILGRWYNLWSNGLGQCWLVTSFVLFLAINAIYIFSFLIILCTKGLTIKNVTIGSNFLIRIKGKSWILSVLHFICDAILLNFKGLEAVWGAEKISFWIQYSVFELMMTSVACEAYFSLAVLWFSPWQTAV